MISFWFLVFSRLVARSYISSSYIRKNNSKDQRNDTYKCWSQSLHDWWLTYHLWVYDDRINICVSEFWLFDQKAVSLEYPISERNVDNSMSCSRKSVNLLFISQMIFVSYQSWWKYDFIIVIKIMLNIWDLWITFAIRNKLKSFLSIKSLSFRIKDIFSI